MSFLGKLFSNMSGNHHGGNRDGHGGSRHGYREDEYRNPPPSPVPAPPSEGGGVACSSCSGLNVAGARFCSQCGKSMMPGSCTACNASITAGAKFCPNCGKPQS